MSHVPHELSEEFPLNTADLQELRQGNAHAARLMDEYHEVNRTLHRVETNIEPMSDQEALRLRKTRITLKDELARILREHAAAH
ncbi:YdcH family protein [Meridianimarinicoccus aquatilis]|uniref:DUF465 domain-containing protein n=1 Tax=Meridianimarinicoccus aquatilis TaxID=2552766 RepID=A0A4R6AY65_9RHOB|nr:DUF465 domain-containing protein [Fluviibacterium aquatile]QIE41897.1 DUF465 domain-containing protein [Rhodobacteraceae bacterium SC52]TDL87788.1 DUF465 domain-containing protein [Fluviibacterium aquatile]